MKRQEEYDIIVIGGGPAGMAAAVAAKKEGAKRVAILEQQDFLGGILPQCIHDGFGLHLFGANMTGPEYALFYRELCAEHHIDTFLSTTVMSINTQREIFCVGKILGARTLRPKAIILAMGCKERSRGALRIPGTRPAGVYTAGAAQYMINIQNCLPGKKAVILGLGDIGLIMARRLTWEGAAVKMIVGLEANGLQRNMVQCVKDLEIPLKLGYTVTKIHGVKRLKGVSIAEVKEGRVRSDTERYVPCDTLLLAAGLLPEVELAKMAGVDLDPQSGGVRIDVSGQSSIPGIFACGNVTFVHDLVDFVTMGAEATGKATAVFIKNETEHLPEDFPQGKESRKWGGAEKKGLPDLPQDTKTARHLICTLCPVGCKIECTLQEAWNVQGHQCEKGKTYALQEMEAPLRLFTSTVKWKGDKGFGELSLPGSDFIGPLLPVKTSMPIPKSKIPEVAKCCRKLEAEAPIQQGQVILENIAQTGADLVACTEIPADRL